MPQLNFHDFLPQLVWLAITFVALYWIMARVALPRIGEVLQLRADRIHGDLDRAAALKSETDAVKAAYERSLAEARAEAQEVTRATDATVAAEANARRAAIGADISTRLREAEQRIAAARAAAMNNVSLVAADAARLALERVAGVAVTAQEAEAAARAVGARR
ncbi:MAG: F0F1 ATP synthase subunit B' [Alphaproteobacteria bacterium]|nr:F0F1 ATP synthase subunit B' [Alphaproteobacteria bacterium]